MVKNTILHDNFEVNFTLKGFTSILIGVYFFLLAYAYKYILDSFLIEDHALGLLSIQIIEIIFISLAGVFVLFSSLSMFFSGKRNVNRFQQQLWNGKTKAAVRKYFTGILIIFSILIILMNQGLIDFITPSFLILYALFLFLFKNNARKNLLYLSGLSLLLGIYCFVIPGYWYSSLTILAIAHATYGIVER
ncbi:hypothetical protein [Polaribacter sp. IC073]|uniref:hypothetical protein n=1 Tax=Polaribacter sp. IC073 TaxID=2508540 RepID=UPI0011BEB7E0|nr:hypothetical protein [Polaribacter sp. IC073]TXD46653.1 hypothetical protein ES045_14035 [Polaribacter sp. IC073]